MKLLNSDIKTKEVLNWEGVHLINYQFSACSMKSRIYLNVKGIAYTSHWINLSTGENFSDWFQGISPRSLVPVLVHDGEVHIESNDILQHLERSFNENPLIPIGYDDIVEARIGKFGPYLRKEEDTRSIPQNIFVGDLTDDIIDSLFRDQREDAVLGKDPESKEDILLKKGPYGHYVQLGETTKRKAIPKGTEVDSVDLELAIKLISLPRVVGKHPDTGIDITADYGRYGPYLKMDKSNARLIGPATPLTVTVNEAVELLSKSKKGSSELKTLGKHPDTGEELVLKEGRYGPYISDGKLNAALRSGNDPDSITLEEAVELINLKRAAPKRKKPRKKRRKKK